MDELAGINHPEAQSTNNDPTIKALERQLEDKDKQIAVKDKWIMRLFIVLIAMIGVFMGLVIFDVLHGGIGYVRY